MVEVPLAAAKSYLVTILTKVVLSCFEYWHIQLWYRIQCNIWMTLGQMIHKHSTSLEAQQTFMTFVDKTMVISW